MVFLGTWHGVVALIPWQCQARLCTCCTEMPGCIHPLTMHGLSAEARHLGVMSPTHYHSFERDGEMAGKGRRTLGRQNACRFRTKNPNEAEIKAVMKEQRSGLGEKEKHTRTRDAIDRGLFVPLSHTVLPSLSFPPPLFFSLIFLIPSLLYPGGLCS